MRLTLNFGRHRASSLTRRLLFKIQRQIAKLLPDIQDTLIHLFIRVTPLGKKQLATSVRLELPGALFASRSHGDSLSQAMQIGLTRLTNQLRHWKNNQHHQLQGVA